MTGINVGQIVFSFQNASINYEEIDRYVCMYVCFIVEGVRRESKRGNFRMGFFGALLHLDLVCSDNLGNDRFREW